MIKPIREWQVQCPCCSQLHFYPEFKGDFECTVRKCLFCNTKFNCLSYKCDCASCIKDDECIIYPTVNPLIHRSTWRGMFNALHLGFRSLALRDLECCFYVRGEAMPKIEPRKEEIHVRIAQAVESKPIPEWKPIIIHLGFFGRRKDA
jgi:hypothetical protein